MTPATPGTSGSGGGRSCSRWSGSTPRHNPHPPLFDGFDLDDPLIVEDLEADFDEAWARWPCPDENVWAAYGQPVGDLRNPPMARPRTIYPDEPTLWDLAYLGCSNREIAEVVGCSQNLLTRRPDLAAIIDFARADRAAAIAALWETHPSGDLRSPGRPTRLAQQVRASERRSIQRHRLLGRLTASSEESSEEPDGQ